MTEADIAYVRKLCHELVLEIQDDEDYDLLLDTLGKRRVEYLIRMLRDLPDRLESKAKIQDYDEWGD